MTDRARLEELASRYGVETEYYDALGNHRRGSDEAVLSVLRVLGAEVTGLGDVEGALLRHDEAHVLRLAEPVRVVWGGRPPRTYLRARRDDDRAFRATLHLEDGSSRTFDGRLSTLEESGGRHVAGIDYVERAVDLGAPLPDGYHTLLIEVGPSRAEQLLIAAPERAFDRPGERTWGAFLPLYALHSKNSMGIGNATDLRALVHFIGSLGGDAVGTLPLLATFLEEPFEYSPYAPVSRLFWNELYVDPRACPEFATCGPAQALLEGPEHRAAMAELRAAPLVDYQRAYAQLRPVLEALATAHFAAGGTEEIDALCARQPRLRDYARFRAAVERHGPPSAFPSQLRGRALDDGDVDPQRMRYHLYTQLRASEQIGAACRDAQDLSVGLYLDMPLGVHPDGYDAYREPEAFLNGLSAGAPPDPLFTGGQKWGFPPPSPEGLRSTGYRYLRECLQHQMAGAGVLRIDHVMGLHRLYCIPDAMSATDGVYVRMPHEELYAIVCLESHRHQTLIVGEDLGTVPDAVRESMDRHALHRMYVLPFELRPNEAMIMGEIPEAAVASVNTHDLPTFEGWWRGGDIDIRHEMGLLSDEQRGAEHAERRALCETLAERLGQPDESSATLKASLEALAASDARLLLVNLEDLWLSAAPQNVPGTHRERPNWRRKAELSLEEMASDPRVIETLEAIDERRKQT